MGPCLSQGLVLSMSSWKARRQTVFDGAAMGSKCRNGENKEKGERKKNRQWAKHTLHTPSPADFYPHGAPEKTSIFFSACTTYCRYNIVYHLAECVCYRLIMWMLMSHTRSKIGIAFLCVLVFGVRMKLVVVHDEHQTSRFSVFGAVVDVGVQSGARVVQ